MSAKSPPSAGVPAATTDGNSTRAGGMRGDGWSLAILAVLTALLAVILMKPGIALDGISYFAFLRSAVQDGNLELNNEFTALGVSRQDFNMTSEGHVRNVFAIGSAVLWLPFYIVGHGDALLLERLTGESCADGYSRLYVFFVYVATTCIALVALVLACRFASEFTGRSAALQATVAVWLASPFVYYQYIEGDYAHVPSALCVALFVIMWYRTRGHRSTRDLVLLGFLGGIAAMVRWQDILLVVLPICDFVVGLAASAAPRVGSRREVPIGALGPRQRGAAPSRGPAVVAVLGRPAAFVAGFLLGAAPQLVYWRVTLGEWIAIPQGKGFLVWDRPEIIPTLFSSYHGLFGWHPLLLLAVVGLVLLVRRAPRLAIPLILLFALQTYLNSIVWDWEAGVSFGARRFIGLTLLFVLGLAYVYRRLGTVVSTALTSLAVVANVLLLYEFHFGLFSRRWFVSFGEIFGQHARLVRRLPEVAADLAANHLIQQWPRATWVVLGPACLLLLLVTVVVGVSGARQPKWLPASLLAVIIVAEATFVRAAVMSHPSPTSHVRIGDHMLIDYRWYENGHYQLDPFRPDYPGHRHFMHLAGAKVQLGSIPFEILDPLRAPLQNGSAITTCHLQAYRVEVPLYQEKTRAIWLAVDGGAILAHPGRKPVGRLELSYADGSAGGQDVMAEQDVWDYWSTPPDYRILWRGEGLEDLTWLRLPADSTRTPRALGIVSLPATKEPPGPGFTVFAVTQETDGTLAPVPIEAYTNTDYMQDPFRPGYALNHFPHLNPGVQVWRDVPYLIMDVEPGTGRGTVITTAYQQGMRLKIPLVEQSTDWVNLVVDGAGVRDLHQVYLGDLLVHYDRGRPSLLHVQSSVNVWDYYEDPPAECLLWRGSDLETLSLLSIPTDPTRIPRVLELRSAGARGNNDIVAGFTVFAITQKLARESS